MQIEDLRNNRNINITSLDVSILMKYLYEYATTNTGKTVVFCNYDKFMPNTMLVELLKYNKTRYHHNVWNTLIKVNDNHIQFKSFYDTLRESLACTRGKAIDLLIIDNIDKFSAEQQDELLKSTMPIQVTKDNSQIILIGEIKDEDFKNVFVAI